MVYLTIHQPLSLKHFMMKQALLTVIKQYSKKAIFLRILLVWFSLLCMANAGEMLDARINIGLKLFRALLAADLNIKTKVNSEGKMPLLLIYKDNSTKGKKFSKELLSLGQKNGQAQIKNIPINVSYLSYQEFLSQQHNLQEHSPPAGIFLLDKFSSDELQLISAYGIKYHLIIYSPFDGDIENDITAGLSIGVRVRPIVNLKILKTSEIQIKSFFLKVAKKYEP